MALQTVNFGQYPVQKPAIANILSDFFKGYQMGQLPQQMAQEQKQKQLAAALQQLQLEHLPKQYELSDQQTALANALKQKDLNSYDQKLDLDRQVKLATIEKLKRAATGAKPSGDVQNALFIAEAKASGKYTPEEIKNFEDAHNAKIEHEKQTTESSKKYANALAWSRTPADSKKQSIAYGVGMGFDSTEINNRLANGETLSDIAKERGLDLKNVIPVYPVSGENIKQMQRRGAMVAELGKLDEKVSSGLAPYSKKIRGYSLKQIADSIEAEYKKDPKLIDKQAKFLAARALGSEVNALRLRSAGANIGIEALREFNNLALSNSKIIQAQVSPEIYTKMQSYLNKWLKEANSEYESALYESGQYKGVPNLKQSNADNDPLGLFK